MENNENHELEKKKISKKEQRAIDSQNEFNELYDEISEVQLDGLNNFYIYIKPMHTHIKGLNEGKMPPIDFHNHAIKDLNNLSNKIIDIEKRLNFVVEKVLISKKLSMEHRKKLISCAYNQKNFNKIFDYAKKEENIFKKEIKRNFKKIQKEKNNKQR